MLLGNYSVLTKDPGRSLGGNSSTSVALGGPGALGGLAQFRSGWNKSSPARAMFAGQASIDPKNAKPNGYKPGYGATVIQIKDGGMASYVNTSGLGTSAANLAGAKEAVAALIGSGDITTADLRALGNLVGALTGTGTVSTAGITGVLAASAALTGSGTLTGDVAALVQISAALGGSGDLSGSLAAIKFAFADLSGSGVLSNADLIPIAAIAATLGGVGNASANITGIREAVAALTGSGVLTADTKALAHLIATLAGIGVLTGNPNAYGYISADLLPYSDLSPQGLASAVWSEVQDGYDEAGTFGANLDAPVSGIGGGSITEEGIADAVWDEAVGDHVANGTFGNLVQRLLTVARYLGLR